MWACNSICMLLRSQYQPQKPLFLPTHSITLSSAYWNCKQTFQTQVSMACKDHVPDFGPPLCTPSIFRKGPEFRDWLITKLLNAEFNCHKAPDFLKLAVRAMYTNFLLHAKTLGANFDHRHSVGMIWIEHMILFWGSVLRFSSALCCWFQPPFWSALVALWMEHSV